MSFAIPICDWRYLKDMEADIDASGMEKYNKYKRKISDQINCWSPGGEVNEKAIAYWSR